MAKKQVSHYVKRPGRNHGDPDVVIPVAEDLVSVPGIPVREVDVSYFSREIPWRTWRFPRAPRPNGRVGYAMAIQSNTPRSLKNTSTRWNPLSNG